MKNINLKDILKYLSKPADSGSAGACPSHFVRDWKIMVLCFATGLVLLSIFSWRIYLSNEIAGGYLSPKSVIDDSLVKDIDIKKLQADLLILETKQADFIKAKSGYAKMVDPSL